LKSFVQNYRLTDSDLTKEFYWGETGSGVTGLPEVDGYQAPWLASPYYVSYEVDFIEPVGLYPIRIGPFNRTPLQTPASGYYANFSIGSRWPVGTYQIIWKSLMSGETGAPFVEDIEQFTVTSGGIYSVAGITGPIVFNECSLYGGVTGAIGYTGSTPVGGETGTQPYTYVQMMYNTLSRYQVVDTAGEEVWVTSNSTSYGEFSWARYGSVLVVSQKNHGMSVGDRLLIRNANVPYQSCTVTNTTIDSFSVGTQDSGYIQGSALWWGRGFNFAHVGSPKTGGTLTTSSDDVKLLSIRVRTGVRQNTTYVFQIPVSALNDESTSMGSSFIPMLSVRQDADHLSATAATISANYIGDYSDFLVANLGNPAASRVIILMFG
jgi:hypothetical protein